MINHVEVARRIVERILLPSVNEKSVNNYRDHIVNVLAILEEEYASAISKAVDQVRDECGESEESDELTMDWKRSGELYKKMMSKEDE